MSESVDDLLIIGGGPVGLASSIYAALAGLAVRVLETKPGVIDKACGEGLMPGGAKALAEMGVNIEACVPFKGIRYIENGREAIGNFQNGEGLGIRRLVLHDAMRKRALELGVIIEEHQAKEISQTSEFVTVDTYQARYVIAADGLKSPTRRKLALEKKKKHFARYGLRQHFKVAPWTDNYVEIHLSPLAEAYITPVSHDTVGVAILFGDKLRSKLRGAEGGFYKASLKEFPALQKRLENVEPCSSIKGAGPLKTVLKKRAEGRILMAGDAAGYLDPLTGEGLRLGFVSAKTAVKAICNETHEQYDKEWKLMTRRYWFSTSMILEVRKNSVLNKLVVPTLARFPRLFDWILAYVEK